jgi:glucan phosphoethanolaminetransferase (alkaline phosphatase superfamily)
MELDDFKNIWSEMSDQLKEKQNFNRKMFDKMSQKKFHSSLRKIIVPELLGSAVCIACAVFIGFNFYKLDTVAFQIVGVLSILLLLILPVLSIMSIRRLYKAGDMNRSYLDTLKEFTVQKIKFCRLQKLNLTLSYLLLVTLILLVTKLFGKNEITNNKYFWIFSISFGYIFLVFFSRLIFKSYNKTIRQTEDLLNELSS